MLSLETSIQLDVKLLWESEQINDLAAVLPELGRDVVQELARQMLEQMQERHLERVWAGEDEVVCIECGVVHCGGGQSLLRRGWRGRKLLTSSGWICFRLRQLTCRECGKTWSPYPEWLGLKPRQRIAEELERKLVEAVTNLSYAKTCDLGGKWLGGTLSPRRLHRAVQERGSQVEFTPAPACAVVVADGTKVPAGKSERGTEVRFALQILGRTLKHGRTVLQKRIAGWSIGTGGWSQALPAGIASAVIVTDREPVLADVVARQHPGVRHQLCEWHLGHTMDHLLLLDRVRVEQRKALVGQLGSILWGQTLDRRGAYAGFWQALESRRARGMLAAAASKILYDRPSPERTTSAIEREMREINRRTDVGVRWSVPGVDHMLRLRHAQRINPDDFERVWSPVRMPSFEVVPRA